MHFKRRRCKRTAVGVLIGVVLAMIFPVEVEEVECFPPSGEWLELSVTASVNPSSDDGSELVGNGLLTKTSLRLDASCASLESQVEGSDDPLAPDQVLDWDVLRSWFLYETTSCIDWRGT